MLTAITNNHVYRNDKSATRIFSWKSAISKCGNRAITKHENDEEGEKSLARYQQNSIRTQKNLISCFLVRSKTKKMNY